MIELAIPTHGYGTEIRANTTSLALLPALAGRHARNAEFDVADHL